MPQRKKFKWYPNVRRFRDKQGKFVSSKTVTSYVEDTSQKFGASIYKRTAKLLEDFTIDKFSAWSRKLRNEIKSMHNSFTMIALGGRKASKEFAASNTEIWRQAEVMMSTQLSYFDRFMFQAAAGALRFDNSFAVRASMYANAGFATYQNAVRLREFAAGQNQERRVLGAVLTEHCDVCIIEAAKDWQPIGTLRSIGDSPCIVRCKCRFEYRKV